MRYFCCRNEKRQIENLAISYITTIPENKTSYKDQNDHLYYTLECAYIYCKKLPISALFRAWHDILFFANIKFLGCAYLPGSPIYPTFSRRLSIAATWLHVHQKDRGDSISIEWIRATSITFLLNFYSHLTSSLFLYFIPRSWSALRFSYWYSEPMRP